MSKVMEREQATIKIGNGALIEEETKVIEVVLGADFVTILLKKSLATLDLAQAIAQANETSMLNENDESWQISAPFIKVTRSEVEKLIGKLSDSKWRILFMNRIGQVNEFDNHEFSIGSPKSVQVEEAERKEYSQLNVRIEKQLKEEMEKFRELINLNQADFVYEAIAEYIAQLKKELL